MNEYFKVSARFYFWDGVTGYTVHYQYGIRKWYIFRDHSESDAIYQKDDKISSSPISFDRAETMLIEYLNTVNQKYMDKITVIIKVPSPADGCEYIEKMAEITEEEIEKLCYGEHMEINAAKDYNKGIRTVWQYIKLRINQ